MAVKVDSYNKKGEKTSLNLDWLKLDKLAKPLLIAQTIKVFLGNQRRGLAKAKTRGQVNGTTKKIYKQKGTGGARHGSRKAPIYVGGGKAHGPDGRQNYSGKINKKSNRLAFFSSLIEKQKSDRLVVVDCPIIAKTAEAEKYFKNILSEQKAKTAILIIDCKKETDTMRYCHNLSSITTKDVNSINCLDINRAGLVLASELALDSLKERGVK